MADHAVVRQLTLALLTCLLVAAACSDDGRKVTGLDLRPGASTTRPTTTEPAPTTAQVGTVLAGKRLPPYRAGQWQQLPPSPLGERTGVAPIWLRDGSGFVEATAAEADGRHSEVTTRNSAYFSFAERRWFDLPDVPVTGGVGAQPTGVRIGDVLVIAGDDCPSTTSTSFAGAELCSRSTAGAQVLLTFDIDGGDRWVRHPVPSWLWGDRFAGLRIEGERNGRPIVSSLDKPPVRFGEFDPASGRWRRLGKLPEPPTADAPLSSGWCFSNGRFVVWYLAPEIRSGGNVLQFATSTDSRTWSDARPFLPDHAGDGLVGPSCRSSGLFVTRRIGEGNLDHELSFVDPATAAVRVLSTQSGQLVDSYLDYRDVGDSVVVPPIFSMEPDVLEHRWIADPTGVKRVWVGPVKQPLLAGRYLIDYSTVDGGVATNATTPRILALDAAP